MTTNTECIVIGDLNVDLIFKKISGFPSLGKEIISGDYDMVIGGSGGNFAAILSKLGIKTAIISKIGYDDFGRFLLDEMKKYGADTQRLIIDKNRKTGITVSLSYERDKSQISSVETLKNLKAGEIRLEKFEKIRHIHFSSYYMMDGLKAGYEDLITEIKSEYRGITFSLDTNDDPQNRWESSIYKIIKSVDILFLNKREATKISGQSSAAKALDKLSDYVKKIVVKLGREGHLASIDGRIYRGYCKNKGNENFVDGTGSGDNFDAGFIYGFLNSFEAEKALEFANLVAEKSIEFPGGVGSEEKFRQIRELFISGTEQDRRI
ncbi:MAG: carbohydrate kinase family protein [Actinobacteria bacterium]|nr:carbohydrate kinase family protein [Actinomycetota bacterium]